jgi:hypothetical protein
LSAKGWGNKQYNTSGRLPYPSWLYLYIFDLPNTTGQRSPPEEMKTHLKKQEEEMKRLKL